MSLTLYAAPMSSATPVVHAVIELGIDCEIVMLDLRAGEAKTDAYRALNPHAVVPTLVVDGAPLFESVEIMQWLGDTYGVARGLWPAAGTPDRLRALSWTSWAYVSYGPFIGMLNLAASPHSDASLHHRPLADEALKRMDAALARLDAELAKAPYLLGERYSLADHIVACTVVYSTYCGVRTSGHANIERWLADFRARPSYAKAWGGG